MEEKMKGKMEGKKVGRFLYWTPRILSIIFIVFLALISLDVFEGDYGFWNTILALLIHNIPAFILSIFLVITWRREWVGAIVFVFGGLLYAGLVLANIIKTGFEWYYLAWVAQISGVAIFTGIMFFIGWRKKV